MAAMSPKLKAFLRKYHRFPRKGELGRKRKVSYMARRKGSRRRTRTTSSRRRSAPRRTYWRRHAAKQRSVVGTVTEAWALYNGLGAPCLAAYKKIKSGGTYTGQQLLGDIMDKTCFISGVASSTSLTSGTIKFDPFGPSLQTWAPLVGGKLAKKANSAWFHLNTRVTKHWRLL